MALLVLLGVADSCRVQEDPHRTLVQGSLQELNDSWTLETDQQAVYDIPESMGESLMLSICGTKQKFSLGLRAADGKETLSSADLLRARWQHHVGDEMTLTLWRRGEILTLTLELTEAVEK